MTTLLQRGRDAIRMPFVRNVLKFQTTTLVSLACGLVSSVVYARLLGLNQFGFLAIVSAFAGLLSIAAAWGQDTALTTFLAEAIGRKDREDAAGVVRYFAQATALALCVYAALIVAAPAIASWTNGDPSVGHHARLLLLTTALQPYPVLAFLTLQLRHKIGTVALLENVRTVLTVAVSIGLMRMGLGIDGVLIGGVSVAALFVPVSLAVYERGASELGLPGIGEIAATLFRRGTGTHALQGLWIAFDRTVARNLYPNLFFVVLAQWAPREAVGLFRVGLRLAQLPAEFVNTSVARLSAVSLPRIASQDAKALVDASLRLIKGTLGMILLAMAGALLFVPPLVPVVYGDAFVGAVPIFLIVLPFNICSALNIASVPLARVSRLVWAMVLVNATGVAVGIGVAWVLKRYVDPAYAMSAGVLVYHCNALLLYPLLWLNLRGKR